MMKYLLKDMGKDAILGAVMGIIIFLCMLLYYCVFPANAEMGYYKAKEVVTVTEITSKEIDYISKVAVLDEEGLDTGELKDRAVYKDVVSYDTTKEMVIDEKATGACLLSGVSGSPAHMGKDLREVAELKKAGWKALVLHETRIAWWDTEDPPAFHRDTVQAWVDAGKPTIVEIHPWRKPSAMGWMRGVTEAQLLEAIK